MKSAPPSAVEPRNDAVTGLAGRDVAAARLEEWLAGEARVHALLIGLKRFDALNLAYGKAAGDAALAEVAQRLKHFAADELGGLWLAARGGGGQFLLLAAEPCSRERWQLVAGQLLDLIARPIPTAWGILRLSPHGALLRAVEGERAASVLDRLGQASSAATSQQGRRLVWADGAAARGGRSAAQLEGDLLRALDGEEIEVVFQPQFACGDDRLTGAEALARWNHPKLGRVGAGALFAIAERADYVSQLSQHIARLAMGHAERWPMDLRLSLNVTAADLASADYAGRMAGLIAASGFASWRLTLEVTEQVLLGDTVQAAGTLSALAAQGVRIALDDFGAGFCNFRYLKILPLHYLKLDRAMVEGVVGDARDLAVLRAIIAMARALDLKVIAEGIETDAQRLLVAAEGCATWQGFLLAQPMDAAAFTELARGC